MSKFFSNVFLSSVILLTSCVQSLYPLTENKSQITFKSELLGHWKEEDGTQYFVDSSGDKIYNVTIVDHLKKNEQEKKFSDTSRFLMTLVNIKGKYFLDCVPNSDHPVFYNLGEQTANFLLSVHYILKLSSITKNSVEIASLDNEQMSKLLQQRKINIRHEALTKDNILLSQKPEILQMKLLELEKFPAVYQKTILTKE
jgi:hypothetical protein